MSMFSRFLNKVYQSVVQDQFTQPLSQHEVLSVINKERNPSLSHINLKQTHSLEVEDVIKTIDNLQNMSCSMQFRMLGEDPSIQKISRRITTLKDKLSIIETYLLENSDAYLQNINLSLEQFKDLREFYSGRKKAQELRNILERLKTLKRYGSHIVKLNVKLKNIKNTLKILQKIPNINKMNLLQLKSIDWQALKQISPGNNVQQDKDGPCDSKLLCIRNLFSYTQKVTNEQFIYIIDKIKISLQNFQSSIYEEVISNYSLISPNTQIQKLISSLLQQKIRNFSDLTLERAEEIGKVASKIMDSMTNLHKIIRWHRVNKALITNNQEEEVRNRCLSVDSVLSDQTKTVIELTEHVLIDPNALKSTFSKTIDSCLSDLISDQVLLDDLPFPQLLEYIYMLSRIAEMCYNFTGMQFEGLRVKITEYVNRRETNMFSRSGRELVSSLQFEKNQWNRLPFYNNYRNKNLDILIAECEEMKESQNYIKIKTTIERLFKPKERDLSQVKKLLEEEQQEDNSYVFELNSLKLPEIRKNKKKIEEIVHPKDYLSFNSGDSILCQSSFKMINIFEKYLQLLTYTPQFPQNFTHVSHLIILTQYYMYYLFNTFLTPTYKAIFQEHISHQAPVDRMYTKRRILYLYPRLSSFISLFRQTLQKQKILTFLKKDINQMKGDNNSLLRAKIVGTQSCRFVIAYLQEIIKRMTFNENQEREVKQKLDNCKQVIVELSIILLTESSQKVVGLELQSMRSLFQTIKWSEPFEELRDYVSKLGSLIRDSYQRLKSSNRGQIPLNIIHRIFVLIWRTLLTYGLKLFLESKNITVESIANFEKFIDEMYIEFNTSHNRDEKQFQKAYLIFKSIFPILKQKEEEAFKSTLFSTVQNYDYIYQILMSILENSQYLKQFADRDRQIVKENIKGQIEAIIKQ